MNNKIKILSLIFNEKLYLNKYLTCLSVCGIFVSETRKNSVLGGIT